MGGASAIQLFAARHGEAQFGGAIDGFVAVGFIVAVQVVHHGKAYAQPLQGVGVEAHLRQVGHSEQLVGGQAGVDEGAQQVEQGAHLQLAAHGGHVLHGGVEQRGMQVGHAALCHGADEAGRVGGEAHAVLLHHVAGAAHRGGPVVAVLGYAVAGTCHHEAGAGGDVEGVLAIAARAHNVYGAVRGEVDGDARLQQGFAEADELVYLDSAHLEGGEQGGYLRGGVLSAGDALHEAAGFLAGQFFVVEESCQYLFHNSSW